MIPFEFEYIRPGSIDDALGVFEELTAAGKHVRYFAGGTELVTMSRDGTVTFDAAIDLKTLSETTVLNPREGQFGTAVRLSALTDAKLEAPEAHSSNKLLTLLADTARGIADRTTRNSITLGGNICGVLPYREAVLPFLVFDASLEIAGPNGVAKIPIGEVFDKRVKLKPGEFVVSVDIDTGDDVSGVYHERHTCDGRVDYPLLTVCMARVGRETRLAVSGALGAPVRSGAAEEVLNLKHGSNGEAARRAVDTLSREFRTDFRASGDYRRSLLEGAIANGLHHLERTA